MVILIWLVSSLPPCRAKFLLRKIFATIKIRHQTTYMISKLKQQYDLLSEKLLKKEIIIFFAANR